MRAPLWTAPGLHLSAVDEDIVVLDLAGDSYEGLLDIGHSVELGPTGAIFASTDALEAALLETGLAVTHDQGRPRAALTPARRELALRQPASRGDVVRAALVSTSATLRFRGKSLADLVAAKPPVREGAPVDMRRLSELVGAARKARPWVPWEGECLQRSFSLRAWLATQGVATDWVFGVRTWPFAAHCWLQIDDLVVGDRLHRVSRYVPIMAA